MLNLNTLARTLFDKTGIFFLTPPIGGLGNYRNHGPRTQRKIALTFDEGPSRPCTEELVAVMDEMNVKGTFFCVGYNVSVHPDLTRRMFDTGHVIGNNSQFHYRSGSLKPGGDGQHIDESERIIREVIGCRPRLYRPPWGWLTPWESARLAQRGYAIIGWDVRTIDWQTPEPDGLQVAEKAIKDTQPGSILLFHDGVAMQSSWNKRETTRAIRHMIPALRAQGYEFVTVPELLDIPAYDLD
ncbi:MAG: polysaccharide deacetylase family protein [Chloroflexales bacterium]|nr:polysaccharide deacetylase family protein [Chloroflexales bacterium]